MLIAAFIMCLFCSCAEENAENKEIAYDQSSSETTAHTVSAMVTNSEITSEIVSEISTAAYDKTSETEKSTSTEATVLSESEITVTEEDTPLPITVPELKVSNVDHSINYLTWTEVEGAQSYVLYLLNEETGKFEEYGEVKNNFCEDTKLTPNTKYTYKVGAKYSDGTVGKLSDEKSIYTFNKYGRNLSSGICTSQGEWIYFTDSRPGIVNSQTSIYKMKTDGSEFIKLFDCSAEQINVVGEYLYYTDYNHIYRIKTDGTEKELIYDTESYREQTYCEFVPQIYSMIVSDEYIFFLFEVVWHWEQPDYDMAGRIKTDRTDAKYYSALGNNESLLGMYGDYMCYGSKNGNVEIEDDSDGVWWYEYDGSYCVTLMDFDGNEIFAADISCDDSIHMYDFDGERLIYMDSQKLYKYSLSDQTSELIADIGHSFDSGSFYNGSIYYNDTASNSFNQYDISTGTDIKLLDGKFYSERLNDTIWLFGVDNLSVYKLENDTFVKVH